MKTIKESVETKNLLIKQNFKFDAFGSKLFLKKGDFVYHITPLDFKELKCGQSLYVSAIDYDFHLYRSYLTMMLRHKGYDNIKEVVFKLKKDIICPDSKTQREIFDACYMNNKLIFLNDLLKVEPNTSCLDASLIYDLYMKYINKINGESIDIFYDYIKADGYDVFLDQHDIDNSWIQAKNPLLIYQADKIMDVYRISNIDMFEVAQSLKAIEGPLHYL